jgi:regulator of sigma E protease
MEILVKIAQFLLSLGILITLHELGHFAFAKLFKTRVEKFYLFFDPWFSLFKYKKGETEYGIGWIPLGGYCKISGMIDESMDTEQMQQPPQPYEFRSKPSWQRLLIIIGGVLVNFVSALFIYSMVLYVWGEEYLPAQNAKYGIVCDSLALTTGLQNGDKIISIDKKQIQNFDKIGYSIMMDNAKTIEVDRAGQTISIPVPSTLIASLIQDRKSKNALQNFISPRFPFFIGSFAKSSAGEKAGLKVGDKIVKINDTKTEFFDEFKAQLGQNKNKTVKVGVLRGRDTVIVNALVPSTGLLGIAPGKLDSIFQFQQTKYGFFESFPAGIQKGYNTFENYLKGLKMLFKPETKAYESVGGFITIGSIFPGVWNWEAFWNLTAFLSIILAVGNILPIPGLDGGHMIFILYEMITGRKPSDKFMEYATIGGLVIIGALLVYANGNDIVRHFFK